MPRRHAKYGLARAEEVSDNVGVENATEPFGVHLLHARLSFHDTGVIDQLGDGPKLRIDSFEQANYVGLEAHICSDGDCLSAGLGNLANDCGRCCFVLQIADAHRVTASSGKPSRCRPDASTTPSYHQYLVQSNSSASTRQRFPMSNASEFSCKG